uniref:Uncharacterized protein n=1 Tax=Arundo donax TaxID=35708 RepID=A0A0A9A3I9_ARUDO
MTYQLPSCTVHQNIQMYTLSLRKCVSNMVGIYHVQENQVKF